MKVLKVILGCLCAIGVILAFETVLVTLFTVANQVTIADIQQSHSVAMFALISDLIVCLLLLIGRHIHIRDRETKFNPFASTFWWTVTVIYVIDFFVTASTIWATDHISPEYAAIGLTLESIACVIVVLYKIFEKKPALTEPGYATSSHPGRFWRAINSPVGGKYGALWFLIILLAILGINHLLHQ